MSNDKTRSRSFHIVLYDNTLLKGYIPINRKEIKKILCDNSPKIEKWAFIYHDKDTYTDSDEKHDKSHIANMPKAPHWHIIIKLTSNREKLAVAKWFGIEENFIEKPDNDSRYYFDNCLNYLLHKYNEDKYLYDYKEVISNFDFKERIEELEREKKLREERDGHIEKVVVNELTLGDIAGDDPFGAYLKYRNLTTAENVRKLYVKENMKLPSRRINIYVFGDGRIGKTLLCKALASVLYKDVRKPYLVSGDKSSSVSEYDYEPAIIWDDKDYKSILEDFGGNYRTFLRIMDVHPSKASVDVKYGHKILYNELNMITSTMDYVTFLNGIVGIEENNKYLHSSLHDDPAQSFGRFPIIIEVKEHTFDVYTNRGFFERNKNLYFDYVAKVGFPNMIEEVVENCTRAMDNATNEELKIKINNKMTQSFEKILYYIIEKINEIKSGSYLGEIMSYDEICKKYSNLEQLCVPSETKFVSNVR